MDTNWGLFHKPMRQRFLQRIRELRKDGYPPHLLQPTDGALDAYRFKVGPATGRLSRK
jgi:hypothetical protein